MKIEFIDGMRKLYGADHDKGNYIFNESSDNIQRNFSEKQSKYLINKENSMSYTLTIKSALIETLKIGGNLCPAILSIILFS